MCKKTQALVEVYGEGSQSRRGGGGLIEENTEGMKYTEEEEAAVNKHFSENIRTKKAPGIEECRAFLRHNKWMRRSDDSIHNKVRNIIRRK